MAEHINKGFEYTVVEETTWQEELAYLKAHGCLEDDEPYEIAEFTFDSDSGL